MNSFHASLSSLTLLAFAAPPLLAAPGDLDLTFGGGTGKVTTVIANNDDGRGVAVQSDGKIVVAGASLGSNYDFSVVRYNADGSLDTTFNGTGKVTTAIGNGDDDGFGVALQSDGKILVAGQTFNGSNLDIAVVRYNGDGSLDTSFGGTGKVTTDTSGDNGAGGIAVQNDGKIVIVGYTAGGPSGNVAVVRYNADGTLDASFNGTGVVSTDFGGNDGASAVDIQADGKIVLAGSSFNGTRDFAVARYNSDGSLDTGFAGTGKVTVDLGGNNDTGKGVAVQDDGKVVVGGYANPSSYVFALVRYNSDGTLDMNFGSSGKVTTNIGGTNNIASAMLLQSDGKIILAGHSNAGGTFDFALARYNSDGNLDTSFNGTGKVTTDFGGTDIGDAVVVQTDGKVIVSGRSNSTFAVARYFGADAPVVTTQDAINVTSTSATLAGTVNPKGTATTAYFEFGTTTLYGSTTPVQDIPAGNTPVNVSAPVSSLSAGATYHYRLVAGNAGGTATGMDVSFVAMGTGGATAVPTATTGNAVNVTTQTATVEGMVNPNSGATLVQFQYGLTTSYTNTTPAQDIGNGTAGVPVSAPLSGLSPGSTYHYRVVGTNDLGTGAGADLTFTTSAVGPSATTDAATEVGISFATLHGTVTPNDLAVTVSFEIAESEAALTGAGATPVVASPASLIAGLTTPQAVLANVSGLNPGSGTYFYRTKATPVGGGASVFGNIVSFSLVNSRPTPKDDTFVILGENTLSVLVNDTDPDPGDTASLRIVGDPTGALLGAPATSLDGLQITYNPFDLFPDDPQGDNFTYTVIDHPGGLTAVATVRVISIRVFRGVYSGLIGTPGGGADAAGRLNIMVSPSGVVTGSFKWQGLPYTFKGANLGADGSLKVTKFKNGLSGPKLEIVLQLDPATRLLTGTLTDTSTVPSIVAQAQITGTASEIDPDELPEPGTYNAIIDTGGIAFSSSESLPELAPRGVAAPVAPRGVGFSQVTVSGSAKRPARFVGRMPDAQKFSSGAQALVRALRAAGGQPRYPLYTDSLYPEVRDDLGQLRSGGVVSGDVGFNRASERFNSGLNWERRPNSEAPRFAGGIRGFIATLNAIKYGRPAPGVLPAEIINDDRTVNAKVELRGGDLPAPPDLILHTLKMTRAGGGPVNVRVEPLNPANNVERLSVKLNPSTGTFSGSFVHPNDAGLSRPPLTRFNGVFQKQDGQGVFTGPTTTGRVYIVGQ